MERHFAEIIDIQALQFRSKPDAAAYTLALQRSGATPAQTLFVDDNARNVQAAKAAGAATVLVGGGPLPGADRWVERVEALTEAWPALVESRHVRE